MMHCAALLSLCHAELVSASISPEHPAVRLEGWTLKQVQGDEQWKAAGLADAIGIEMAAA
ncbi:MAG: hypothetical protein R3E02_09390 [Blastomonas sp.]